MSPPSKAAVVAIWKCDPSHYLSWPITLLIDLNLLRVTTNFHHCGYGVAERLFR